MGDRKTVQPPHKGPLEEMASDLADFVLWVGDLVEGGKKTLSTQAAVLRLGSMLSSLQSGDIGLPELYDKVPDYLVSPVRDAVLKYVGTRRLPWDDADTAEEVLRRFMDFSQSASCVPLQIEGAIASEGVKIVLDRVSDWLKRKGSLSEFCPETAIKPYILAVLWGIMLTELSFHAVSSTTDSEIERMCRMGTALALASIAGVTGYFHSGGDIAGFRSPTSVLTTIYNAKDYVRRLAPAFLERVPKVLQIPYPTSYPDASQRLTFGKILNMAYTFRIGDSFLNCAAGKTYIDASLLKNVLRMVNPLIREPEAKRMYALYFQKEPLYTTRR